MGKNKRNSVLEILFKPIESNGFDLDQIPLKLAKVGNYYGKLSDDSAIDEADEKPVTITSKNLPSLGNRKVAADGRTVSLTVMGQVRDVQIEKLRFSKGTCHWPSQVRDQVPEIAEMVELRRRIREVQQNPRLKKRFVAWLRSNQKSLALLEALSDG